MDEAGKPAEGGSADGGLGRRERLKRLWALALLLALAIAAGQNYVAIADYPDHQVHSDDLLWMHRFKYTPRTATEGDPEYTEGIDQGALERWVYHCLLLWTGKMPGELREYDYSENFKWNVEQGNVAPADPVHFVRVVNAAFMIGAVVLVFVAIAGAVTPLAGFVAGFYLVLHPSTKDVMLSLGSDPLLWLCLAGSLALWVKLGASRAGAVLVGLAGGLAASAKLNGAVVVVAYCAWLLLKRRPLWALLSGGVALAAFLVINPIVFSKGVFGVPSMLKEMAVWRSARAGLVARDFAAYAGAPRWHIFFYLLGAWWALVPLLVVSRRLWRLDAAVFWATALAIGHLLTVTAPIPRYTLPMETGIVYGLIAAYWPRRAAVTWKGIVGAARKQRQVR